jgi:hypothetical protein
MYRTLNPQMIVSTLDRLRARIHERFPHAGLERVCGELCEISRRAHRRVERIERPAYMLRTVIVLVIAMGLALLMYVAHVLFTMQKASNDLFGTIQAVDATFNIVVLTGASIYFLASLEERMKRWRTLKALNELRSIVHVIDMHQLTKDPMMLEGPRTAASPERDMSPFELTRYLDYCAEMLSLTAKIAAMYSQSSSDGIVIEAVSDLTTQTTDLSAKVWQKIALVHASEWRTATITSDFAKPAANGPAAAGTSNAD